MRAEEYLAIDAAYARWLGGLRWSADGEAVEFDADAPEVGLTFAMAGEVALALEGFALVDRPIAFAHVLHLLHFLGLGREGGRPAREAHRLREAGRLADAFRAAGRPLRNAGALGAMLSRSVPRLPDAPALGQVARVLVEHRYDPAAPRVGPAVPTPIPQLPPAEFEAAVLRALATFTEADLAHWLKHGRGPLGGAGERVAREADAARPRSLDEALGTLERRPRLAGAARLVEHLAGALSLPPRKLAHAELPTGGYADVATRGHPEQILPAQFALDPLEFLRRFAGRELLYFHREEPHAPVAEELLLLLDQGVRTWGDVRLVLAAATLALGRRAARRGLPLKLATTGEAGRVVDPLDLPPEALGALVEASDLTPHPAEALARVLEAASDRARDVVVLTHPRSLTEPAVAEAARRVRPPGRLFAVAVDAAGAVTLAELRRGGAITVGRSRVAIEPAPEPPPPAPPPGAAGPWRGVVEPIGFPFRLGALGRIDDALFDFDAAGDWLLAAGPMGLLHAWRVDGTALEMLPRGLHLGRVPDAVEAVVGVAGGFVVVGRFGRDPVAVHYDFATRTAAAHPLPPGIGPDWLWFGLRDLHAVAALAPGFPRRAAAIDLAAPAPDSTSIDDLGPTGRPASPRARQAERLAWRRPAPLLCLIPADKTLLTAGPFAIRLDGATGELSAWTEAGAWPAFTPLADGRPALAGARLIQARAAGPTLALLVEDHAGRRSLRLFGYPEGRPLGEYPAAPNARGFALAADGRRFARRVGEALLEVRGVEGGSLPLLVTSKGKAHSDLEVQVGRSFLLVQAGRHLHLIRWDRGHLELMLSGGDPDRLLARAFDAPAVAQPLRRPPIRPGADPRRFVAGRQFDGLVILVDVLGQVAVLDGSEAPVVIFLVFRDQIAAWMPDGTRLGPAALTGGRATPDAPARIGAALARARARAEGVPA